MTFIVPPQFKKSCLSSANDKWRQYKTHLTNNFIWKRLNDEENLHKPPVGFGITGDEWSQFVITRMSDDFKKLSEQQKERRKQNIYPHRIARKGYARLASELSTDLCDDEEVNRAILWKKGRTSKQGEIQGDVLKATFSKIDAYIQQKKEGLLKLKGPKEDILTKALESKEHGGRVRGIGGHVNPSTYFRVGRGNLSTNEQNLLLQQAKFEDRIAKLETLVLKNAGIDDIEEKGSCNAKGAKSCVKSEDEIEHFKKLDFDDDDEDLMFIEKEDALEKQCKKKSGHHEKKLELNSSSMPKSLWLLYCYYKRALDNGETIKVILDFDVFGETCTLYVNEEDVTPFCQLMPISYTCIGVYIWSLYKKMMDENKLDKFRFVHPYGVGHLPTTKTDTQFLEEQLEKRARALVDRLFDTPPNTAVLVPCNVGFHWILTVININKDIIYLLDPLGHRMRNDNWKHVVDM
nr:putative Ulp1 protease family catalytic domain, putative transposase, Ptta/En/Spm, plant [Ipomoea batatas]